MNTYPQQSCTWLKIVPTNFNGSDVLYTTSCGYSCLTTSKIPSVCPRCGKTTTLKIYNQQGNQDQSKKVKSVSPTKRKAQDLSHIIQFPNEERVFQTTNNINENMPECVTRVQAIEAASYWETQWNAQYENNAKFKECAIENAAKLLSDFILFGAKYHMLSEDISIMLDRVCAKVRIDVEIVQHQHEI